MANSNSGLFKLNVKEIIRGVAVAVTGAAITAIYSALNTGMNIFDLDWKAVGSVALAAGLSYIVQKVFRNSNDELFKTEKK